MYIQGILSKIVHNSFVTSLYYTFFNLKGEKDMKTNYCDIVIVLDRSGSMESIKEDVIGGFNRFLKEQQAIPGEATITLVQFDNIYEIVYMGKNLQEASLIDDSVYKPRGSTALLDAIGKTIDDTGRRLSYMPENQRPSKVIFGIQTDGYENASKYFTIEQISSMINHQKNVYSWEFVFMGANQDAITEASKLGIDASHAMHYRATAAGVRNVYSDFSDKVAECR